MKIGSHNKTKILMYFLAIIIVFLSIVIINQRNAIVELRNIAFKPNAESNFLVVPSSNIPAVKGDDGIYWTGLTCPQCGYTAWIKLVHLSGIENRNRRIRCENCGLSSLALHMAQIWQEKQEQQQLETLNLFRVQS